MILTRDRGSKAQFGQRESPDSAWYVVTVCSHSYGSADVNDLERLVIGPIITPSKRCAFHEYDDYSLWHHSLMIYLQLCTRYPTFRESKVRLGAAPFVGPGSTLTCLARHSLSVPRLPFPPRPSRNLGRHHPPRARHLHPPPLGSRIHPDRARPAHALGFLPPLPHGGRRPPSLGGAIFCGRRWGRQNSPHGPHAHL